MIKCLECGFEADRLQWTHFKYKCTGRFSNGTEYMKAYPDARVVDPKLATKTTLTLDNFILKYGELEGKNRWDSYRKKQADSNLFEYKKLKHGWTKEQFDLYNSSRAITLEKCIERHGERKGLEIWNLYREKQSYSNTKEYFCKKYGEEEGLKKFLFYNAQKGSSNSAQLLSKKLGISFDEAVQVIITRNKSFRLGSEIECEFTRLLEEKVGILEHITARNPFGKWSSDLQTYVIYDIKHKDCIIEFNGDYWHCNPKLYEAEEKISGNRTAAEVWEKDRLKIKTAESYGFRVLVVWESDFRKDKNKTIERAAEWIANGQK